MIRYNPARARDAVQFIVDSSYAVHHIKKLRTAVARPRSLPFKGEAEVLNELLVIGRQSRVAMENLIAMAEERRDTRNDYQRDYMAAKRQRERKVVQLETLLRGRPLSIDEAAQTIRKQQEVWRRERERALAGVTDWHAKNATIADFWRKKDHELEELIAEAQRSVDRVVHRRTVVELKPKKETLLGQKLRAAFEGKAPKKVHVAASSKPH
jgi:hypothetical protein